ncbi:MAG: M20/M25/M40 family metallo-hydrolase [Chloroflexi bacterium]|nr:M20/M25/M40 family metallo-hydrolase [Chloroflexota bacterium]
MSNPVDQYIESRLDDSIAELSRLCAQPSVSAQGLGVKECVELVAQMVRARGFTAQVHPTRGHPIVTAEAKGKKNKTLLFYNHYDVQPPEPLELWNSPPFTPTLRDGKLFARGVSDDKGHIQSRLSAIDAVRAANNGELPCHIKFVIEGEEEISSVNLPPFVEQHARELAADACIWESGGVNFQEQPTLMLGMRGICYVELSVECLTQDVHSGQGGSIFPNAAWRLTWALATLKDKNERVLIPGFYDAIKSPTARDLDMLAKLPDSSADWTRMYGVKEFLKGLKPGVELKREQVFVPTCTICGLNAGYQGKGSKTVLPARASAKIDFRLVPDQDPEDIVAKLRAHLDAQGFSDVRVDFLGGEKPGRTDPDHPFIKLVADCMREIYNAEPQLSPIVGGSGPYHAFLYYLHVPIGISGVGHAGSGAHAPNENMRLDLFVKGTQHTARVIQRFAER